jgi:Flp pilus assembly protein TadG
MVGLIIVVLFGFVGLALDGGRAYLDRREMQAAVDAAALAAANNYMNTSDYGQAEQAATNNYALNERLYTAPICTGYGTLSVSCTFGDPTNQSLGLNVASHSIAGVTFRATATHAMTVTVMQVLGAGPTVPISATATAVARKAGTYGAAIQTLSAGNCNGAGQSLVFTGTSTTTIAGDIWSNGSISDNGSASGSVSGNVIDICPNQPPLPLPNFTVSGSQANGFNIPDPGFAQPALNTTSVSWNSTSGGVEQPGTYASDPKLTGGAGCYFLSGGVYDFSAGLTDNGGFVSNELRPPDEPNMASAGVPNTTTTTSSIGGGTVNSISVNALSAAIPGSTTISVGGQTFTVDSGGANVGDTSIKLAKNQSASAVISAGAFVSIRALSQFWDSNGVGCAGSFSVDPTGNGTNNLTGTWSVEVTAVRWSPNGVPSCSGPASPTCYGRESAPSMCKTVTPGPSGNIKVLVSSDPGAQSFNVYLAQNASCSGLAYLTNFQNNGNSSVTINSSSFPPGWPTGAPSPPDAEGLPMAAGLPNADPAAGTPPRGDLANERHCVDPGTGSNVVCPSTWTPGAVIVFIPGGGNNQTCLNLQGGGDVYLFSGYQFGRILLFEPGPEQAPPANTCLNNVAGHGITSLIGIFYVPAASVTIIGSSNFLATIAGGIICWTATVKGNGGVSISADPSLRTWPSAVRLIQ